MLLRYKSIKLPEFSVKSATCKQSCTCLHYCRALPWSFHVVFDSHLTFSDQISSLSLSLVIITFVNFAVSAPILTSKLPGPLPYLLFTLSLITVTLYYNLPKSQTNRLQVIQNSLARAVVKAPKFCHITPILKSLHWLNKSMNALNINFLLPTKFLPLLNLLICTA